MESKKAFHVHLWGSHPDNNNDDDWIGADFFSESEARKCFDNWRDHFHDNDVVLNTTHVELNGPNLTEIKRVSPDLSPDYDDSDWKREMAMEAGMLHGVQSYNDIMGY